MTLNEATAHDLAPIPLVGCTTCGLNPLRDLATWRDQCASKQCDVLGCVQPKDAAYSDDHGRFTWCRTHGKLYKDQGSHARRVAERLRNAATLGLVLA